MARLIYTIWWLLTLADGVGAVCVAIRLWPERKYSKFVRFTIFMFVALAIESFMNTLAALIMPPTAEQINHLRVSTALIGRSVKALAEWRFFIYLLRGRA